MGAPIIKEDEIDWWNEKLTPELILFYRSHQDTIGREHWYEISKMQNLSNDFIREFQDYVNWGIIAKNKNIDRKILKEFRDKIEL